MVSLAKLLLLPQRRHGQRNAVSPGACAYASLAGIGRRGADIPGGRALGCPEHISQHARGCAGAVGRDRLHIGPR